MADYAREQCAALGGLGVKLTVVCPENWTPPEPCNYEVIPALTSPPQKKFGSRLRSRLQLAKAILSNHSRLVRLIQRGGFRFVLSAAFSEYLAPLWAGRLQQLHESRVVFFFFFHDPVRDYIVGPRWWHRWSISSAYSYLQEAFVHDEVVLDTGRPFSGLVTTKIPHGPFPFPVATETQGQIRSRLGLPKSAKVMLAFGYIRDSKNLDLVIRAMADFPEAWLLVAGAVSSQGQHPITYYQELAQRVGIAERCRWLIGFVPRNEIGNLFAASDLVLLTYSAAFRSASGVLNAAISYRKLCVASGGQGSLSSAVRGYDLGIWVEPDDLSELKQGIKDAFNKPISPKWEMYERENSWNENARIVCNRFGQHALQPESR